MKTIATIVCLYLVTASTAVAQGVNDDDPQIGFRRLSEWKKLLRDQDRDVRSSTALSLGRTRAESAVPALIEALDDEHYSVKSAAARALGFFGTEAAVDALIKTLKNDNKKNGELVRGSAAEALGGCCRVSPANTEKVIPELIAAFSVIDLMGGVRRSAAYGLARIGNKAVPELIEAAQNPGIHGSWPAIDALRQIGQPAVPALIEALNKSPIDSEPIVRALCTIGPPAEGVPTLVRTIKEDKNHKARAYAATALGKLDSDAKSAAPGLVEKSVVPALIDALKDDHPRVRSAAVRALRHMGPQGKVAVPLVIEKLKDEDRMVRSGAAGVLAEIAEPELKSAVPALTKALDDEYVFVRTRSAKALGRIGPDAKVAVTALIETLTDRTTAVSSIRALVQIDAQAAIPVLIKTLSNKYDYIREETAEALGGIGPEARAALPALKQLTKDPDRQVAKAATEAIERIDK